MYPILFKLHLPWVGEFPVRSFGLMVVIGVMVGMWWLAGALRGIWFARKRKLPIRRLGDAVLPALFLGQVFGRIGCFLVGDDYGKPWDGPWAIAFPKREGGLIPDELVGVPLHPTQLYLSLMDVVICLLYTSDAADER